MLLPAAQPHRPEWLSGPGRYAAPQWLQARSSRSQMRCRVLSIFSAAGSGGVPGSSCCRGHAMPEQQGT